MTEKMIIDAYCRIRKIDNTIPDEVLDFMKDAAIERIRITTDNDIIKNFNDLAKEHGMPAFGTKEFNDNCARIFGGNPK